MEKHELMRNKKVLVGGGMHTFLSSPFSKASILS